MSKAILCVDDDRSVVTSLMLQLREKFGASYIYELAENGQEALDVVDELMTEEIDTILVISDWLMPGMKGDEFLIKLHEKYPTIIKIMLTGHAMPDAIRNATANSNLFCYIAKPWDKDELMGLVEKALLEKH